MPGGGGSRADAFRWLARALRSPSAHRARWGIMDQGISSLTNFAATAVVAHQVGPGEFGSFSVAVVGYICILWVARTLVGEPFVIRMTTAAAPAQTSAAKAAVGAAVVFGAASGGAMTAVGLLIGSRSGAVLTVMGLFMPALLAQDAYRYVLITTGRARDAAINDGVWLTVQVVLVTGLLAIGHPGAIGCTVAFGTGATAAGLLGAWQSGTAPSPGSWWCWLRAHWDLGGPFVIELLVVNAAPQLSLLCVAPLAGVLVVGQVRAAMLLCVPPTVLFSGLVLVAIPEAVRLRLRSLAVLRAMIVTLAIVMTVVTGLWAGALTLVPTRAGTALLGANWGPGIHLMLPVAVFTAATACAFAALVGLRALEATRASLRTRRWAAPTTFASCVIGAQLGGAEGAAMGLAASAVVGGAISWAAFQRAASGEAARLASEPAG